jgi:hypothetical protein
VCRDSRVEVGTSNERKHHLYADLFYNNAARFLRVTDHEEGKTSPPEVTGDRKEIDFGLEPLGTVGNRRTGSRL